MDSTNIQTMNLFAKKQGKQATKGQKQIYEDNLSTINFYVCMGLTITLLNCIITFLLSRFSIFWTLFSTIIFFTSISAMKYMAKPKFSGGTSAKNVVDAGIDLNMESGFADYLKDIMIATSICQILTIYSIYFWFLWLFIPFYFSYLVWINLIWPWIHQTQPEQETEMTEKKKRKMERKYARYQ